MNKEEKDKLVAFWVDSSKKDYKTMNDLFATKNYSWSLFMGHLVIEKLAKALFVSQQKEYPPLIHDLRRIVEKAGVVVGSDKKLMLDSITRFNIRARYDDYKQSFYNLSTQAFTKEWIANIKECKKWIKAKL